MTTEKGPARKVISFDLDGTLMCLDDDVPKEPNKIPALCRPFFRDTLRLGTVRLMKELISRGCEIAIYTSSYRPKGYIKRLFKFYGIRLSKVINQSVHEQEVIGSRKIPLPSKLPCKFRINLHVDDQDFMISDGVQYGFDVVVVKPDDIDWTEKVIEKVEHIQKRDSPK